jgi:hypothetical protein
VRTLHLTRLEQSAAGTFGALVWDGYLLGLSLELPWRGNAQGISCIPCGAYRLVRREEWSGAARHGHTYEVEGVPGRAGILIHPANTVLELEGCIAPGNAVGYVNHRRGVVDSSAAFRRLRDALDGARAGGLMLSINQIILEGGHF